MTNPRRGNCLWSESFVCFPMRPAPHQNGTPNWSCRINPNYRRWSGQNLGPKRRTSKNFQASRLVREGIGAAKWTVVPSRIESNCSAARGGGGTTASNRSTPTIENPCRLANADVIVMPDNSSSSSSINNQVAVISRTMWGRRWHRHDSSSPAGRKTAAGERSSRTVSTTTDDSKQSSFDEDEDEDECSLSAMASSLVAAYRRRQQGVPALVIAEQQSSSPVSSPLIDSSSPDDVDHGEQSVAETTSSSPLDSEFFLQLMRTAEAALNAGELRDGLDMYGRAIDFLVRHQQVYESADHHGEDNNGETIIVTIANLCYTCSRIARRVRDYHAAYQFGALELQHVQDCCCLSSEVVVASNHQDLAHICHYELGDSAKALEHYRIAYGLHRRRLQNLRQDVAGCPHCKSFQVKALCPDHKALAREMLSNVQETKQCIGRIQFGLGMVADAMTMLTYNAVKRSIRSHRLLK